jgi:hypothetical protein
MAIFGEASSTAIAGFILTGVSFLIQFIGFVTPGTKYKIKRVRPITYVYI